MFNFIISILTFMLKVCAYGLNGIVKIVFNSTKQQKITLLLLFSLIQISAVYIYPITGNSWMHVVIVFAPFIYLYNLGRSGSV